MMDYYTVTEYASLTGKDSGNIRRMLINGTLAGEKLGNRWIIPKGENYPPDRRLKTGNYRNWRKKINIIKNKPTLMKKLLKMCYDIHDIYGESIDKIILYGSYARGEENIDSDVDIALLLKTDISQEQHDKMIEIVVDYELELAVSLSVIPIEAKNYLEWKNTLPFYRNIEKEGIILWKTA